MKNVDIDIITDTSPTHLQFNRKVIDTNRYLSNPSSLVLPTKNFYAAYDDIISTTEPFYDVMSDVKRRFDLIKDRLERRAGAGNSPHRKCNCKQILSSLSVVQLKSMLKQLSCKLPSKITKSSIVSKILKYHD